MNEKDRRKLFLPKKVDLVNEMESHKIKLRKNKLEDYIWSKRISNNFEKNKFEIKLENLTIPEDILTNYGNKINKIDSLIKFIQSEDINILKFAILKIRLYTLDNVFKDQDVNTEEYLKMKFIIESMLNFLKNSDDRAIQYESSFILLNITANTDYFNNFLIHNVENLSILIFCLTKYEDVELIYENILWIFSNFFIINDQASFIYYHSNFYKIIMLRYISKEIFLIDLKITFIWLFGNIFRSNLELTDEYLLVEPFMKLFNEAIQNQLNKLLEELLSTIQLLVERNTKIISELLNKNIVNLLLNLINSTIINKFKIHKLSFSLIGCLLLGNPEECKFIVLHNVIEHSGKVLEILKENLSKDINKIAIEISFMLSNLVYNDLDSTKKILTEENILDNLLRIDYFFQSYEYKKHILLLFKNCIFTLNAEKFSIFLKSKGFDWVVNCLNSHYLDFILDSLLIIKQILEYNKEFCENNTESSNIIEKYDLELKLNELLYKKLNDKVHNEAKEILEEYFSKDQNFKLIR